MIHRRPGGKLGFEVIEGRRRTPGARGVAGSGRQVAQRQDPAAGLIGEPVRSVHGQEVKEDRVARLQVESADVERIAVGLNRSEEHTSELQSLTNLVCRLLLEKKT